LPRTELGREPDAVAESLNAECQRQGRIHHRWRKRCGLRHCPGSRHRRRECRRRRRSPGSSRRCALEARGSRVERARHPRGRDGSRRHGAPEEVGEKVLRGIQRNDFYIFTHPEFKEELQAIFAEALAALPDEPAPAGRVEFEDNRRARNEEARKAWKKN
jgi:hypothetical protein